MARARPRRRTLWAAALVIVLLAAAFVGFRREARLFFPVAYRGYIVAYAGQSNLDPRLVAAVIKVESGFRSGASSRKGALGLMQVMPETGRWAAGKIGLAGFTPVRLYDPPTNIRLGCWYLGHLEKMFGGRTVVVLAAYNAGDHKVLEWFPPDAARTRDSALINRIPYKETRLFVQKVLLSYTFYRRLYDRNLEPK